MKTKSPKFSLYDNGWKTVDRYTFVDNESADIMNGETYMQCTSFSIDFDEPLGVISHDVIYPEDLYLLGDRIEDANVLFLDNEALLIAVTKIRRKYYS